MSRPNRDPALQRRLSTCATYAFAAVCMASCGDKEPPTEPEPPNQAPVAMGAIPGQTVNLGETVTVEVSPYFSDPDGDALEYTAATSNAAVAAASVSGSTITIGAVAEGDATVTVTARDPGGLSASQSMAVTVEQDNEAPVVVGTIPAQTIRVGESVQVDLSPYFSDPDGDALAYDARPNNAGVATAGVSGSALTISGVAEGSTTVTVAASDPGGLSASQSVSVTVGGRNQAPEAVGTIPEQTVAAGESAVVNLSLYFTDPDGDELTYDASSNDPNVVAASVSGSALTISGVAVGRARVTTSATDGSLSAEQVIFVSVETAAAGICGRTEQVVAAILARIRDVSDCALVTEAHLAAIDRRIDLGSKGITSLKPGDFAGLSSLKELTITDNPLTVLPDEMFAGLRSLETLWLFNNRLTSLPRAAFFELAELKELRLTNNLLSSLEEGMFIGLSTLQSLHLNGNRLTSLPDRVFAGMPVLEEMQLSRNQLSSVTRETFSGLPLLARLWLYENRLDAAGLPDGVFSDLISLWALDLGNNQLTNLSGGEFSGLSSLGSLDLSENLLTSLPDGAFAGMSRLYSLWLHGNPVDPLQLIVSLESAGEGRFRARAHTGAPFEMVLPITVANGTMAGGSSVTIARGSAQSRVVSVTRTAGTTGAVTVDLGALPGLPTGQFSFGDGPYHQGYELARSADLPLQVLPAASASR